MLPLYIVLFFCLFAALYLLFIPGSSMSVAAATVDNVRHSLLSKLKSEGRKEKLDILGMRAEKFLAKGMFRVTLQGLLVSVLLYKLLGAISFSFVIIGFAGSLYISRKSVDTAFKKWQMGILEGAPALSDYFPAFLEIRGVTTKKAMEYSVPFINGPLKTEFAETVKNIGGDGDAEFWLNELGNRTRVPLIQSICTRLAANWDYSPSPDLFLDLQQEVANAKEIAAMNATAAKQSVFILILLLGVIGVALLAGYPLVSWMIKSMSAAFGA